MKEYYLAIDIGASNGRHILSYIENDKIILEEVHRFENSLIVEQDNLCWDYKKLFEEILIGLKKCKEIGKIPLSIGIDTWGVDFVLLDKNNNVIGNTVAYRDNRTDGMDKKVYELISEKELYSRTGIQKQMFNTIYQLMAIKENNKEDMDKAKTMLLVPDYFNFLLTGKKVCEYTNATTTQLVSPITKNWDMELIELLGYNTEIFAEIVTPTTLIGTLSQEIVDIVGYSSKVVAVATHDTASAIATISYTDERSMYISSGTWSLMGIEDKVAHCDEESRLCNFTNEGGVEYRFRYLKNIMGLWIIQSVKKELEKDYNQNISFQELCEKSELEKIQSFINCNDERLLAPESMIATIKEMCFETKQEVPNTAFEIAKVVYQSLAKSYSETAIDIERLTGRNFDNIYIVGGGAKADYLNKLTAQISGKNVVAMPIEGTALGNIIIQMIANKQFENLKEARNCITKSFDKKIYNV